jgi:hypothetical protein
MDLLHTTSLLNEESIAVNAGLTGTGLLVHLTNLEDVLEAVKSNLDDLVVGASKQITEGLDAALRDKVADLLGLLKTTRGSVGDSPASLLAGLEVAVGKEVDERSNDTSINDGLDLAGVASGDVGDGPAGLLADAILGGAEERKEGRERATVDNDLGLDIVTGDNITNGTESGSLNGGRGVHEELHQATRNAGLNDSLDLVVGAIGKVRDSPAGVDQDLVIEHVNELGKDGQSGGNSVPVRLGGLATAEVAESPCGVAEHAQLAAIVDEVQEGAKSTGTENEITAVRAVTSNVTKGPDGLLTDIGLGAAKKLNENGDGTGLDNNLGLLGGTGCNVGQGPGRLKLHKSVRGAEELDKAADNTGLDNALNRGVALLGQQLAELGGSLNLLLNLIGEDTLHHLGEFDVELYDPLC